MDVLWQPLPAVQAPVMHATACSLQSISLGCLLCTRFYLFHCIAVTPQYTGVQAPLCCSELFALHLHLHALQSSGPTACLLPGAYGDS